MNQVIEFFKKLLDTSDFPPRWHYGTWSDFHGWFYIISDLMIWGAYLAIPIIIIRYTSKRKNIRFHNAYFLFAAFILACGLTHLLDAVMFWFPAYRLNALIRFITAVVSWLTVYHLFKISPTAFALKTPEQLESDVEQRRLTEQELVIKNKQLNEAQDIAKLGHWEWNIATGNLVWSPGMYKVFDIPVGEKINYDDFMERIYPEDREYVANVINDCFNSKVFPDYYHRLLTKEGEIRTIHAKGELLVDVNGKVVKMLGTGQDVTEQKKSEKELISKTKELENVNEELEKFAYVASHDLQEPLRKLIAYTSLLETEYKDKLDEKGKKYLQKISGSSVRMQNLIHDILNLSRFSSDEQTFEPTDLNIVVKNVLSDLEVVIGDTRAIINAEPLPTINANESQMQQLFQNIISNGIKFCKNDSTPVVNIACNIIASSQLPKTYLEQITYKFSTVGTSNLVKNEKFCRVTISDNGIGFNNEYEYKIFEVFQRLQTKGKFDGTGIGLAICKKIVENHDGIIWAKGDEGNGSVFTFILPVNQKNFQVNAINISK